MFGKLLDIALSPVTDIAQAIKDPLGQTREESGKIPPIARVLIPGASIAQAIVDAASDDEPSGH